LNYANQLLKYKYLTNAKKQMRVKNASDPKNKKKKKGKKESQKLKIGYIIMLRKPKKS
jgi:hypothetical protein